MPMSGQPGRMSKVEPIGVNLRGLDHLSLDLNYTALGPSRCTAVAPAWQPDQQRAV